MTDRHHAILVALAVDQDIACGKVQVGDADGGDLGPADGRIIKQLQDDAVAVAFGWSACRALAAFV